MKQNKNTYFKFYRIISSIIIFVIIFSCLSYSAFAVDTTWYGQPLPHDHGSTNEEHFGAGYEYLSKLNNNNHDVVTSIVINSENVDVYYFSYNNGQNGVAVSRSQFVYSGYRETDNGDGTFTYNRAYSNHNSSTTTNSYGFYTWTETGSGGGFLGPGFDTLEEGYQSLIEYLDTPVVTPHPINLEIPPGYVAFVDISGLTNIRGSVTTGSGVPLTPNQWASTNVVYGYSSSIPSSFNLPLTGSTSFSWTAGRTNVFGKSQNWSWLGVFTGGSNYLFLCNPTYSNVSGVQDNGTAMILDNPSATNSYVYLYLNQAKNVKLISLNASIVYDPSNGQYGGIEDGSGDSSYTVAFDDDAGSWVTRDDETDLPVGPGGIPIGGDNSIDTPSEFSTIQSWLENIANLIGSFFRGAIGAVSTLVSAGSAFINSLVSLYSWLPPAVYSVLSSALILVITIGVIKVFI